MMKNQLEIVANNRQFLLSLKTIYGRKLSQSDTQDLHTEKVSVGERRKGAWGEKGWVIVFPFSPSFSSDFSSSFLFYQIDAEHAITLLKELTIVDVRAEDLSGGHIPVHFGGAEWLKSAEGSYFGLERESERAIKRKTRARTLTHTHTHMRAHTYI